MRRLFPLLVCCVFFAATLPARAGATLFGNLEWADESMMSEADRMMQLAASNPTKEPEYIPIENPDPEEREQVEPITTLLPIWGEEARAQGYELPLPIGLSVTTVGQLQEPKIEKLKFGFGDPTDRPGINLDGSEVKNVTLLGRADIWVFPFLNIYGFGGVIKGHADININVNAFSLGPVNIPGFKLNIEDDYNGVTKGLGATLAGGYKQYFATLDMNYSKTDLDFLDGEITTYTVTPRIGLWVESERYGKGSVWAGVMYLDLMEHLKGSIDVNVLPGGTRRLNYDLYFTTKDPYSALIGGMWDISQVMQAMVEVSYGGRTSVTGQFTYRF